MSSHGAAPGRGYLVLADISGYTAFLAGTELEHANDILRELLEFIVGSFKPLLALAQIEGDAVLAYAPDARLVRGETLLELIEATYAGFRDRLATIGHRTTCTCRACQSAVSLDLKFVLHYGEYLAHPIMGQDELIGLDVSLVRDRGLKERVNPAGWRGYALFTEPCLAQMGVWPAGLEKQAGSGDPATYGLDLQARYSELNAARRVILTSQEADVVLRRDLAAPPPVVWDWLNDPAKRSQWMVGRRWSRGDRPLGRTSPGARNHCDHAAGVVAETILDWRPFQYLTVDLASPSRTMALTQTYELESSEDGRGTRLVGLTRIDKPLPRWLARSLGKWLVTLVFGGDLDNLARRLARQARHQA